MKFEICGYDWDLEEGDIIDINHSPCQDCGYGSIIFRQIRQKNVIKEWGSKYCCD